MKRYISILILLLLVTAGFAGCGSKDEGGEFKLSKVTLPDLKGEMVNLSKFEGKVVILNFWATWCPPCRAELPDFLTMQADYGSKGLQIVGISVDTDDVDVVKAFAEKTKINFQVLYAGDKSESLANMVGGIRGIPTSLLIDRKGNVVKKITGAAPREAWDGELKKYL